MSSNATSFVSLPRSTELFVMMRIKLVKIVVRSGIENTTVPSNATSQPTSSAVSAEMPDIWREIARIDSVALTGETDLHLQEACPADLDLLLAELVLEMLSTARWR
jgi:hypothetical protein